MRTYDVLCIGNYTQDTIISSAGARTVDGGAAHYAAYAAARLGKSVAVVTRLVREDDHVVETLTRAGIDCYPSYAPQSTRLQLEYPAADPDLRKLSVTSVSGSITVDDVQNVDARAAVIGASLRGEVGLEVIRALKERSMRVAADMQGFVRVLRGEELRYEPWQEMSSTLARLDIVKSDAVEAEFLTGEADIRKAAEFYARLGPREIVLTHKGGLLIYAEGEFHEMSFYAARLDGRSGRGDTCIGAYVAMRLSLPPREAGIRAAAVTSLKMENPGPFDRPLREVEEFIQMHYS